MICHEPVSPQSARQLSLLFALTTEKSNFATSPSTAPATRHDCETWVLSSPSTAPATKSDLHQILHLPRKLSVQRDCNFTKYCTCHEKWPAPNFAPATAKTEGGAWLRLYYSFTLLFFDSTIILLYYSFTLWSRLYIGSFSIQFLWLNLRWVNKANQNKANKQKTQTKIKTKLKQNFSKTMAANISLTGLADNLLNQNEIPCTVINRGFTTTRSHLGLWESFWLNKLEDEP